MPRKAISSILKIQNGDSFPLVEQKEYCEYVDNRKGRQLGMTLCVLLPSAGMIRQEVKVTGLMKPLVSDEVLDADNEAEKLSYHVRFTDVDVSDYVQNNKTYYKIVAAGVELVDGDM